jgi:ubiquinone/menaquinone biosynthesis C-methylase UbiE
MDPQLRFSNRVNNYKKYRPHYPHEIVIFLKSIGYLSDNSIIADIGSGTGISTELFLENDNKVYAVEPNTQMREAAEQAFAGNKNFISINASAEGTTLLNNSIDLIIAGQAFHWFNQNKCRVEFKRVLKPGGAVVIIWNDRRTHTTPFLIEYENLLKKYSTDYSKVDHKNIGTPQMNDFFAPNPCSLKCFNNYQHFDYEGIKGRLLSSSYVPAEGQEGYPQMLNALEQLFKLRNKNGKVVIEYDTKVYYGRLA